MKPGFSAFSRPECIVFSSASFRTVGWLRRLGSAALSMGNGGLKSTDDEPEDHEQTNALVHRAMSQVESDFEPRTWQVFYRSVIDQIATNVVAGEFEISQAAVRQIRSRVLRRVRQQFEDVE